MAGVPKKNTEWYIKRLKEVGREEYVPIEEYKGSRVSILHKHIICGEIRKTAPNKMLDKNKNITCVKCTEVTHEVFVKRVREIHGDRIKITGVYKGRQQQVEAIHIPCGKIINPYVNTLMAGMEGCKSCSVKRKSDNDRWTHEEYVAKVKKIHGDDIVPLEKYKGHKARIRHYHASCNREWITQPRNILEGHSCEPCRRENKKHTSEDTRRKLYKVYQDEIEWIDGEYDTLKSILTFKNTKCGHQFDKKVGDMLNPYRRLVNNCPRCTGSRGEMTIEKFLMNEGIKYIAEYTFEDCRNKNVLPFDFAIINEDESIKMLIEFDGQEHFESVKYFGGEKKYKMRKRNDQIKNEYCKKNNIRLIRIPYWDYNNIESILEEVLGLVSIS